MANLFKNLEQLTRKKVEHLANLLRIIVSLSAEIENPNSRLSFRRVQEKKYLIICAMELLENHFKIKI
jgi:hypothetical protein